MKRFNVFVGVILTSLVVLAWIEHGWNRRSSPTSTPTLRATTPPEPRIFYFGVAHHTTVARAVAADATWGRRVMPGGFPWYLDRPDARLPNVTVILPPEGDSYSLLYHRTKLIWRDVWLRYPGYDWYVRCWDDNFVFGERVAELARVHDPNALVEIGRTGLALGRAFVDGGATSLVSRALLQKYVAYEAHWPTEITLQEDVTISFFRAQLGARFEHVEGYHHVAPKPFTTFPSVTLSVYPSDLSCRRPIRESTVAAVPYTFHYVSEAGMYAIDKAWYQTPCQKAERRTDEIARWGLGNLGEVTT